MISVVIPTYNEEKNIETCLQRIANQTIPRENYEIIVVDGNSSDNTREIARKHANKVILQKSEGIPGARNDGVKAARFDLIATTDADVEIPKNWLEIILKNFEDESVLAVCGADEPIERNTKSVVTFFFLKNFIRMASKFNFYCLGGTNSAFRKDVFLKVGGYRNLSHSDDVDLGFRIKKMGKISYDKNLLVKLSVRRMEKNGYLKTLSVWTGGNLRLLLGLQIKNKKYAKEVY